MKPPQLAGPLAAIAMVFLALSLVSCAYTSPSAAGDVNREVIRMELPSGAAGVDVYWPRAAARAPLVIVAHGFSRHRGNMSGWGEHLAREGLVVVVPDLPSLSDHVRNGRFLSELRADVLGNQAWSRRIDPDRVGLIGYSAGGLSSLLSAAESPGLAIWIGLDPVDRDGLGARAASMVRTRAVVLTAEASSCNAHGNARDIVSALPQGEHAGIPGAVHVDAEWPTSRLAELVCGRSTDEGRTGFKMRATRALQEALGSPSRIPASP